MMIGWGRRTGSRNLRKNFIELLEVDRPDRSHDFETSPPFFSFGDHNRLAVRERDGLSMMVFKGDNARSDISSFAAAGLATFAPFDFERVARIEEWAHAGSGVGERTR